jgi:hypothetical protein
MLSVKQCREILGADSPESEADLELLRDQLYGFARVAVEACPRKRREKGLPHSPDTARRAFDSAAKDNEPQNFPDAVAMLPEDERYELQERAAIVEFDGGLDRSAAEQAAFSEFWRAKHRGGQNEP